MKKANVVFVHKKNEKHTVLTLKWLGEGGGKGWWGREGGQFDLSLWFVEKGVI